MAEQALELRFLKKSMIADGEDTFQAAKYMSDRLAVEFERQRVHYQQRGEEREQRFE